MISKEEELLSDIEILDRLVASNDTAIFVSPLIEPEAQIGPSSLDVHLGTELGFAKMTNATHIDLTLSGRELEEHVKKHFTKLTVGPADEFVLHPGEFTLGSTLEYFRFPNDIAGRIEGRSSFGRLGLQVHATAGFVDPGFEGTLTFEFINAGKLPLKIVPGRRIGQLCFFRVKNVQVGYLAKLRSKYGRRLGVEFSRVGVDTAPLS